MHPGRVAFVLGGGGVQGACEVGMLRALSEAGVVPDLILGTSVGAINGAMFAKGPGEAGVIRLGDLWEKLATGEVFGASLVSQTATLVRTRTHVQRHGPLRRLLREQLDAGPGDSLLLLDTLMNRDHLREPRTVMKATMQLDPVADVFFNRLPSRFIDPEPRDGDDVEASITTLAADLGTEDALLIFPEGGNFTRHRWVKAILRLRQRGHAAYADKAQTMLNVLPPRPGGVSAALAAAPHADVVFVAHTGLEHLATISDLWHEIPQEKTLYLRWWFYGAAQVPRDDEQQLAWLFERWADIDSWIAAHPASSTMGG